MTENTFFIFIFFIVIVPVLNNWTITGIGHINKAPLTHDII